MRGLRSIAIAVVLAALIAGCATHADRQRRRLNPDTVQTMIEEGVTTEARVLKLFGAPNVIERDTLAQTVWTYDLQTVTKEDRRGKPVKDPKKTGTRIISGSFTLMITFGPDEIVKQYRMLSTKF